MIFKKILALTLAGLMSFAVFSGCQKEPIDDSSSKDSPSQDITSAPPQKAESGKLSTVHTKVKELYGEKYIPEPVDAIVLEEGFGIKPDMVKDFFADVPFMNVHVDTFIGIEAAEGKADEVEAALNAYKEKFLQEKIEFPYLPDHLPKAQNAQVVRVDDYVFFVMVADISDVDPEALVETIKTQIQTAVDTIKDTLK